MYTVASRVAQIRVVFETLRDVSDVPIETSYTNSRERVNTFLDTYKSSAPLDICFKDVKERLERIDTLDELISRLSLETNFKIAIVFLEDVGEWTKTIGLIKSPLEKEYKLIDTNTGTIHHCKDLDYDVREKIEAHKAEFGYLMVYFSPPPTAEEKNVSQKSVEEEAPPPKGEELLKRDASQLSQEEKRSVSRTTQKRHKPVATSNKKKKGVSTDMTSEESTNK